jgi:hypothetical protein
MFFLFSMTLIYTDKCQSKYPSYYSVGLTEKCGAQNYTHNEDINTGHGMRITVTEDIPI